MGSGTDAAAGTPVRTAEAGSLSDGSPKTPCTSSHYSNHTKHSYEKAWFYADDTPYQHFLIDNVENELGLASGCAEPLDFSAQSSLVDVGCGTGNFTRAFVRNADSKCIKLHRVLGQDPFLQSEDSPTSCGRLSFLRVSAEDWLQQEVQQCTGSSLSSSTASEKDLAQLNVEGQSPFFNLFIFKEVIHHFEGDAFDNVFQHLCDYMRHGLLGAGPSDTTPTEARAVIVTRMHDPSHYPFFEAAKDVWRRDQHPAEDYVERLERIFYPADQARDGQGHRPLEARVTTHVRSFPVEMPLTQWCDMVKSRFWSSFSAFSDEELDRAVREEFLASAEFRSKFVQDSEQNASPSEDALLKFEEKLVFITISVKDLARSFAQAGFLAGAGVRLVDGTFAENSLLGNYARFRKVIASHGLSFDEARFRAHVFLPWLHEFLTSNVTLRSLARSCLGTDTVLIWSTDFCVKEGVKDEDRESVNAKPRPYFAWHQDSTYSGWKGSEGLTVWIAFSDVSSASAGGLRFLVGQGNDHRRCTAQIAHVEVPQNEANMLSLKQQIDIGSEQGTKVASCSLLPGCASVHDFFAVHSSLPNEQSFPRVGLAVRLLKADAKPYRMNTPEATGCAEPLLRTDRVTLLCGTAEVVGSNFDLEEAPREEFGTRELETWRRSMELEKTNYFGEQQ